MIKKLLKSVREYKRPTLLTPLFVAIESALEVFIPFLLALMVDNGIEKSDMPYLLTVGGILLIAAMLSLLFGILAGRTSAVASSGFAKNLRNDLFDKIQGFSFANVDKISPSGLITRMTTDVMYTQMAFMMSIRMMLRAPLMFVFSIVMAFITNPQLALIFLTVVPFLAVGMYLIVRKAFPIYNKAFDKYDKMNNIMQENLHGIRVVKSYVREDHEVKKFDEISLDIYKDFSKAEKLTMMTSPLMQASMYACILLIAWFGSHLVVQNAMGTGELMSMITYGIQILMNLMMFSFVLVMLTISKASAKRITQVLDEESLIVNPENPVTKVESGKIEFKNVSFRYHVESDKESLSKVDLTINSGETIGIIGGTGSSKSTLVQLIPRLYDATEGEVLVGGKNVREYDLKTLRDSVAMVLQKNILFSGTIKENLKWGDENATDEDIKEVCRIAQADSFINTFKDGYDHHVEQGGANLSGGQRQRLCIARALLKKPTVLILDDSTSAVDMRTDASIRRALKETQPGTTKIIIAQRIASVEDSDRIIVMDNGVVSAFGTHDELLKSSDIYKEVYDSQKKGGGDFDAEN